MSTWEWEVQMVGVLGYFLLANSYFSKEKEKLLRIQIICNMLLTIHFYCLAGIGGAICNILCLIADIIIFISDKKAVKRKDILALSLIIASVVIFAVTLKLTNTPFSYKEIFPIFATSLIIASLVSDSKNVIRIVGLIAAICWLAYGIIFHSYAGIFFEVIIILSTIISYVREKIQNKKTGLGDVR